MRSMTGYGHSVQAGEGFSLDLQIKGVNNRFLEISQSLSPALSAYSGLIESEIKNLAHRGRVEVTAKLLVTSSKVTLRLDEGLACSYKEIFSRISELTGAREAVLADYLAVDGMVTIDASGDEGRFEGSLRQALSDALLQFMEDREREGEGTKENLASLGGGLEKSLGGIEALSGQLEGLYHSRLVEKYEQISGEKADTPDFLQELGVILVRYTINEEINRLKVHLREFWKLLEQEGPVGKTLDFLAQEMQRECNTIASKSQMAEVNLLVVAMKDDIENIREQARNLE